MDQCETDWISGSILKNNHASSSSPLSSASSSTPSINYWMHNLRHENNFNNGSTLVQQLPESFEVSTYTGNFKIHKLKFYKLIKQHCLILKIRSSN